MIEVRTDFAKFLVKNPKKIEWLKQLSKRTSTIPIKGKGEV